MTKRMCLYLNEETKEMIEKLAKETGLKKSEIVRQAIKEWGGKKYESGN